MRNRGTGGFILVGFDNQTSAPALAGAPSCARTAFHADKINGLVNRYASERFEVHVHFPVRDAQEFPVLEVDAGTEALVAARRPLQNASGTPARLCGWMDLSRPHRRVRRGGY